MRIGGEPSRLSAMLEMGRDLLRGVYPSFVYGRSPAPDELPAIFTFHRTTRTVLEPVLARLQQGGYRTLTSDEYLAAVRGKAVADPARSVLLTFDDGDSSIASVLDPLLERYQMRAVVYLIPGRIREVPEKGGTAPGSMSLCTWPEIEALHAAGRIDFQSHTLLHNRVFTGSDVRGFVNPSLVASSHPHALLLWEDADPAGLALPVRPSYPPPPLGAPLYDSAPRMLADRAVREDPEIRRACLGLVEQGGGLSFFERPDWRERLEEVVRRAHKSQRGAGSVSKFRRETTEERDAALRADLSRARRMIEERLPGKRVRHLAWPWGVASEAAVDAARDAGYEACYWGRAEGRFRNFAGGDPLRLARIGEDFLQCLPGPGRVSLPGLLLQKLLRRSPSRAHGY